MSSAFRLFEMISELLALLRAPARAERTGARSSVGCEAVEQAGTARALQRVLTATARAMRGVPGVHVPGVLESGAVMVTHDGRALTALRPVPTGGIATGSEKRPCGSEPVRMSCTLTASPRPLTVSPFSVKAVCLV